MTYRINCCKSDLTFNLGWSPTSESESMLKSDRIETEVRRGRGWSNKLSHKGSQGLMNVKLNVELEGNLRIT